MNRLRIAEYVTACGFLAMGECFKKIHGRDSTAHFLLSSSLDLSPCLHKEEPPIFLSSVPPNLRRCFPEPGRAPKSLAFSNASD